MRNLLAVWAGVCLIAVTSFAQQDQAFVTGTVSDAAGAVIPGASVQARDINTNINERFKLQFRWEVFNVTNHPSFGTPNANIESPDAGIIRSTLTLPRQMQFGLRLSF